MICGAEVLRLFMDNFDYNVFFTLIQHFREDFLKDLFISEIMDEKVTMEILDDESYVGKIYDFKSYACISNDIITRKLKPLDISREDFFLREKIKFHCEDFNIYIVLFF